MKYSDDYIHECGEIFTANNLHARGILFEKFLQYPQEILNAVIFKPPGPEKADDGFQPLLPGQRLIRIRTDNRERLRLEREQIERDLQPGDNCVFKNGSYVERLHHHSYSKTRDRHVGGNG
ncbi:MAG: hypothetical protein FVQ79_00560 [Planctomycetes bacterium]|nr:hypothetical protein [Planctomycetota bacterium]